MQVTKITKLLLTVPEAAGYLGFGRTKVYELVGTGEIPSVRVGGSRRIKSDELVAYVASLGEAA